MQLVECFGDVCALRMSISVEQCRLGALVNIQNTKSRTAEFLRDLSIDFHKYAVSFNDEQVNLEMYQEQQKLFITRRKEQSELHSNMIAATDHPAAILTRKEIHDVV